MLNNVNGGGGSEFLLTLWAKIIYYLEVVPDTD